MRVDTMLKKEKDGSLYKETKLAADYGTNSKGYKLQGKTDFQGIPVAIENRAGSVREGENDDGSKWRTKFKVPYGYVEGTKGADGEEIDTYVGPDKGSEKAFVVHQKKDDGSYDEDTIMLGFTTKADAKKAIHDHYDDPKYIGDIVAVGLQKLRELFDDGKKLTKISMCGDALDYFNKNPKKLEEYKKRHLGKNKTSSAATAFTSSGAFANDSTAPAGVVTTGLPAKKKPKRGDVPTRDDGPVDPKTESVQTNRQTTPVVPAGTLTSHNPVIH